MSPSCPSRWRSCSSRAPGTPSWTARSAPAATLPVSSRCSRGSGTYVAVDRDASVAPFYERFAASASAATRFVGGDFALVLRNMASTGARAEAILMDLGTSSMQVDTAARGFSYASDAPLDMRMDASSPLTAAEIVNTWDEREIAEVLSSYGEERYARQIARAIVRRRAARPIERSADLVELIRSAIPTPARFGQGHPAKRVFQALRIATNDELQSLARRPRRRARRAARRAAGSRHQLPLARGPDRQALHPRRRARLHVPAGLPGLRVRPPAGAAISDLARRRSERRGAVREPALGVGQAARRREDAGRVSVAVPAREPVLAGARRRPRPRRSAARGRAGAASPQAGWPGSACSPR